VFIAVSFDAKMAGTMSRPFRFYDSDAISAAAVVRRWPDRH
jgi:hypothetical protein